MYRVLKGYVNSYVVESDDGLVLVDCGMPKKADRIAGAIRDMGRDARDVHRILITHHHLDHVGSLPVLARIGPDQPPCPVNEEVGDGDVLDGGFRVVHTPGHTAGHTSYLLDREGGVLIAGDAAGARGTKAGPPIGAVIGMYTEGLGEAVRSFRKLAALEFEVAVTGHGQPVRSGAAEVFRRNLSRLPG